MNLLYDSGILKDMYLAGLISEKALTYRDIYVWTQQRIKDGLTKNKAVHEATIKFCKDERSIWRALNTFTNG